MITEQFYHYATIIELSQRRSYPGTKHIKVTIKTIDSCAKGVHTIKNMN